MRLPIQLGRQRRQRGMTLIEVLIAIIIFAIGLLGIAALQVAGMRYTKGSESKVIAAVEAENLADRMRANTLGIDDYVTPPSMTRDCSAASLSPPCSPTEMAAFDMNRWTRSIRSSLGGCPKNPNTTCPAGVAANVNGTVCIDSTPNDGTSAGWACDGSGSIYAIKIEWLERKVEGSTGKGGLSDNYGTAASTAGYVVNRYVLRLVPL